MTLPNDPTIGPDPSLSVTTSTSEAAEATTGAVSRPTTELLQAVRAGARSARTPVWKKLVTDPQAMITISLLIIVFGLGAFASFIAPHGANDANLQMVNAPVGTPGYILGADESGRDIFSRLLFSTQTAAISGLIGAGVALVVGVIAGLVGGYFGRVTQATTEWIFSLIMTFPGLLLLIILMPVTGGDYRATMLIFGVLLSPGIYRIVRNLVLGVKNELYVDAARVAGLGNLRILGRHILFVVRGPIIIATAFLVGSAIAVQAGLAFLGVGSLEVPSFGAMISSGFRNLYIAPTQFLWPSILLGVITASLVLLGNALRDTLEGSKPKPTKVDAGQRVESAQRRAAEGAVTHLLEIRDLVIAYPDTRGGLHEVVKGVSLDIAKGQVVGLVGESGSGKSQTAFATLGVLPNEAVIVGGSILFDGVELVGLTDAQMRPLRGKSIAYIPQEPMSNLDPSFRVGDQLVQGVRAALDVSKKEAKERVLALLERCGIADPIRTFDSYPHQISGGMAQRVLIAGAVASRPRLLIADEPTTALDVTVQAEILDLIRDLQSELDMAVLLVTHNFGVVADICDSIAVMQNGRIVERGHVDAIFDTPQDPYTKMLLGAILDEETVRTDPPVAARRGVEE
ncbi:dipeptide/oligopeptide/nickel ABC transporter permease/ATP-binding protein [Microbacterium sp. APC 3901]|uniref:dipeptide/oligopeptide/nickel ABC transporter permease/ATP-binding protein n=1 Tax=Microbacterium sp. APC 3901 TaxID=3035192 RepID=UPI0025B377CC|nr:dipeptide/oligopeptide/nickel ABC transporter permease/ATP-binding protein [Microbacterium sp. APC 3901]MDN3444129.1 dipeptide/oligopeptide/nickel ABC transporter permease/ATP-binding protein [Microbacterium sp. APC 3901]